MRFAPYAAVITRKDRIVPELAHCEGRKQPLSFLNQDYVARLASLAVTHGDDAGIRIE